MKNINHFHYTKNILKHRINLFEWEISTGFLIYQLLRLYLYICSFKNTYFVLRFINDLLKCPKRLTKLYMKSI